MAIFKKVLDRRVKDKCVAIAQVVYGHTDESMCAITAKNDVNTISTRF
jgi:hypothetical protein